MKRADQIAGVLLLAFSVFVISSAVDLGIFNNKQPGPGFMAMWTGILLAIASSILIAKTLSKKYKDQEDVFPKDNVKYTIIFLASALVSSMLVEFLGMTLAMGLLAGFLVTILNKDQKYSRSILVTIAIPIIMYVLFVVMLDVPFPKGILSF